MNNFLHPLSGLQKLFLTVFIISVATIVIFFFLYGIKSAIIIALILSSLLYITKSIWYTHYTSKTPIRIASLTLALATITSFGFWQSYFTAVATSFLEKYLNISVKSDDKYFPYALLVFIIIIIWIVNHFSRDNSGMGTHPEPIKSDIKERNADEIIISISNAIRDNLRSIDLKTNWSNEYFISLEAEVEVISERIKNREITDLLKAIKKSDDRLFLVLGDPGSGKSVALRKLCVDLLDEVKATGKLPIYINLKEWQINEKWSLQNLPTTENLKDFVFNNLCSIDIVSSNFFSKHFDSMYDNGRLYFILDSFDEIPAVLDEKEDSEIIDHLSEIIFKFLKGARSNESQGILSSRIFRKPTKQFQTNKILEIRPLSEKKIRDNFKKRIDDYDKIITEIFTRRKDLTVAIRNPFLASLFIDYLKRNNNSLPSNQFDMYSSYIKHTIEASHSKLKEHNLTLSNVIDSSIEISKEMYSLNSLELDIQVLSAKLNDLKISQVADVLKFGRIGRNNNNYFSFSHRRFAEFFYVQSLGTDGTQIDLNAIPTDSQYRDALVLYCQITSENNAILIANYCWNIISKAENWRNREVLHSIRFLNDAFISRKECMSHFLNEFSILIENQINKENDMLLVKFSLESAGLLESSKTDRIMTKAFSIGNAWTNEIAIKSCRHLPEISNELETHLHDYVGHIPYWTLVFKEFRELNFSLSLSDSFKNVKKTLILRLFDLIPNLVLVLLGTKGFLYVIKLSKDFKGFSYGENAFFIAFLIFITYRTDFKFFSAVYARKISATMLRNIGLLFLYPIVGIIIVLTVTFARNYEWPSIVKTLFHYVILFIAGVFLTILFLVFINYIILHIIDFKSSLSLKLNANMTREEIYNIFKKTKTVIFKRKLIDRLAKEVEVVTGEWPEHNFLSMTSNDNKIRLVKLDEKWLHLD